MNILKNMKISQRLSSFMVIVVLVVVGFNAFNYFKLMDVNAKSSLAKDESLVFAMHAKNFQVASIQVQQWLTDISATRGAEGFDDGFALAEEFYQEGLGILDKFEEMFMEEQEDDMVNFIQSLKTEFTEFYEFGSKMAQNYIDNGPDQGNIDMALFDPIAEKLINSVDSLVGSQTNELDTAMMDIEKLTHSSMQMSVIVTIFLFIFISFTSYYLIRGVTGPLNKIIYMVKDMAQGEGDLTVRLKVESKDELGELAKWFDQFVIKLQDIIQQVVASAVQLGDASGEISSTSEQLAAGAEEQQAQLSEVATSMEEMSAMILESSKNANGTQDNASQADQAAGEGRNAVKETIVGIEGIASIVNSASVQISALEQQSKDIGEVIQVIDDIADQTNLLALNANIEAARAGDAGRGFAVVADEVRKLAERTVNATAEIGHKIKKIQADVSDSVSAMIKITDQAEEGQKLAGLSGRALEDIAQSIAGVNSAVIQISTAADEQSTGAEEISRNIESVSSVSKEAAISSQQLASSAEQLNREVTGLSGLMTKFKV
ncbi:MAG: methyl-accepting chemotaxis protein [Candidatus Marinimicrobia bacterium]|jgi:methyl-accepting chemotaxis protein|nr:methyl-accepting chemotaxis protein [Candidatus Neomarinimicrobiota bacterium]MBT3634516.1 methyl-accepting chemotaxis protein [Candidatus Neomarinimicrobiota bacterium]MBT3683413.1 methyl-accepting chemotaxis protein [Candidatus Neomarinimicrobiota bacterium]MBT3760301.1 methyl-accepting chemotaxis protein [Candidatus Neomarinimicrobiota bacterium]MBT3896396.1 methyl-accepting chemotaxis protein [Candidatus Neomarinimicrobiota bacterium]